MPTRAGEIYDLKLLLPELAMRLAEDEDTWRSSSRTRCARRWAASISSRSWPSLTPRYDAKDIFLATLTLYLREQTA